MKAKYLFPYRFKKIGWIVLIPSVIFGLFYIVNEYKPNFLDANMPAIMVDENELFGMVENNLLNEIVGILIIVGSILLAFSKERSEDELISKIRLESLVWAVYINYGILLFSFLFVFDFSFLWVMIFNMFIILFFFIIRFYWQISKLRKMSRYEE